MVKSISSRDSRVKLFSQNNLGPAGSRARGLKEAKGGCIAWCDSDDWVEPNWLLNLYLHLVENNADISCCRALIEGSNAQYNPQEILCWNRLEAIEQFLIHKKLNGCLWNKMIRRELFVGVDFDLTQWYWEDMACVWKILKKTNKVVRCNEGTYHFYVHSGSMCAKKTSLQRVRDSLMVWDNIYEDCFKGELEKYKELACAHRLGVYVGEMISMFKDSLKDERYEKIIRTELKLSRKHFGCLSIRDRVVAYLALVSMTFTRNLVSTAYYLSHK